MSEERWSDNLPESVRSWDEVKNADTADTFWKRIGDQREHLGRSITIPSKEAGEETWNEFNSKLMERVPSLMPSPDLDNPDSLDAVLARLGKPDDVNGYELPDGDDVKFDDSQAEFLRKVAHESGLTKSQFKQFTKALGETTFQQELSMKDYFESQQQEIKRQWGAASEERTQAAINFAETTGAPKSLVESITKGEIDAETMLWLHAQSKNLGEGGKMPAGGQPPSGRLSPSEAEERISEIYRNPDHPYHRGEPAATKRFMELVSLANGQVA